MCICFCLYSLGSGALGSTSGLVLGLTGEGVVVVLTSSLEAEGGNGAEAFAIPHHLLDGVNAVSDDVVGFVEPSDLQN